MTLLDADLKPDPVLGEDTWELFEAIEHSFGINLGDYHTICGMTVSELAELVCEKANYPTPEKCLSSVTFYRLRHAFETQFNVPNESIRPTTFVSELIPFKNRPARWKMLQDHVGLKLPNLQFPLWLLGVSLIAPPVFLLSLRALFGLRIGTIWIFNLSLVLYYLLFARVIPAIDKHFPLPRLLPKECATFGGFSEVVLALNYAAFASQNGSSREGGVLEALRLLIALQLGLKLEGIEPETRVPQDLNIY